MKGGRGYPAAGGRGSLTAGPHLSVLRRKRKKKGGAVLGRWDEELGRWAGLLARVRKRRKACRPGGSRAGLEEKGERERERRVCLFFFKFLSNSFFKHSNSNQT
jgi:hypothetical protein